MIKKNKAAVFFLSSSFFSIMCLSHVFNVTLVFAFLHLLLSLGHTAALSSIVRDGATAAQIRHDHGSDFVDGISRNLHKECRRHEG